MCCLWMLLNYLTVSHGSVILTIMSHMLTLYATLRYDGFIPERGTAKVLAPMCRPNTNDYKVVHAVVLGKEVAPNSSKWGRELPAAIANMATINELATPPALTWQPALGRVDMGSLTKFVGHYGLLTHHRLEDPVTFAGIQFILRLAWKGDKDAIALIAGEKRFLPFLPFFEAKAGDGYTTWCMQDETGKPAQNVWMRNSSRLPEDPSHPVAAFVMVQTTGLEIVTKNLWDFARLNFLRDHLAGRTRVCENPGCVTPYFVYRRRRQIYCSQDCAMAAASRNYRRRVRELVEEAKAKGKWSKGRDK